jgi:O-antigen/teichoic acid export membrane protein
MNRDPLAIGRTRRFHQAVISSTLSKASGFLLQAISLPLVFHTLSDHQYAIFLLVSAILSTLNLTQMGTGPGLTQQIAKASAAGDKAQEAEYLAAAFTLSFAIVLVAGAALIALIHVVPPERLLGAEYAGDRAQIIATGNVCVGLISAHVLLGNVDSALAGYQEQAFTSVGTLVANCTSAGLIYYVCQTHPSVTTVILASFAPTTASRIANLCILVVRRPYLLSWFRVASWGSIRTLLGAGLAFWIIQLASVVEQNAGLLIVGRYATSAELAQYGFIYKAILLSLSAVTVVTQPLWPAYIEARLRGDIAWIRRVFAASRKLLLAGALLLSLALVLFGRELFLHVLRTDVSSSGQALLSIFAAYAACNIWAHVYYMALLGLGSPWRIAAVIAIENGLVLVAALVLTPVLGIYGMALAYLIGSACVPVWYLPLVMRRTMQEIEVRGTSLKPLPAAA